MASFKDIKIAEVFLGESFSVVVKTKMKYFYLEYRGSHDAVANRNRRE